MVCIVALCITIWGVFVMFRNRVYALVTMLIFAAVEQFIYSHIDIHSVWNGLHYINIINIININATFSSYRNWGVGTYVFPVFSVVLFVHIICAGVIGYIAINVSASMKPYKNTTFIKRYQLAVRKFLQGFRFYLRKYINLYLLLIVAGLLW